MSSVMRWENLVKTNVASLVGCLAFFASTSVSAGLITVPFDGGPPPPNDCSGVFGQGFENCEVNGSSIIAKYEFEDDGSLSPAGDDPNPQINSLFPSVEPGDFSFTGTDSGSGTWSYNQTGADPDVRYWVAKGGPDGFNLFYVVDDAFDGLCAGSFEAECLDLALAQTSGDWSTLSGGLSHLSFYDTATSSVPEPGTLGLIGAGLLGLGLIRRRRG